MCSIPRREYRLDSLIASAIRRTYFMWTPMWMTPISRKFLSCIVWSKLFERTGIALACDRDINFCWAFGYSLCENLVGFPKTWSARGVWGMIWSLSFYKMLPLFPTEIAILLGSIWNIGVLFRTLRFYSMQEGNSVEFLRIFS